MLLVLACAMVATSPAAAQRLTNIALEDAVDAVRPGQYAWRDDDPTRGEVSLVIDRATQIAMAYRADRLIGVASVSTGKRGKATPLGDFTILQKRVFHRSNLYSNAPMPYMQRLTWDGIALHAGVNPGYPASHGCIRLPHQFAVLLYGVTRMGAAVSVVENGRAVPLRRQDFPVIIADVGGFDGGEFAEVTWTPGIPMIAPPAALRPSTGLSVLGDEWLVPDVKIAPPPWWRWRG
ncbi:L,D-transpeptidase family protein [Sphingomonas sp.]|uniref:L,D-transpeptidase family protein n=1 Tax=Sphingomonas sp. TaxID=28214 RepID=UPI002DD65286|nr:L,D-transpeptidase family protein [Sphingomonas sp.]